MPAIFSMSDRDAMRRRMIEAGWACLLERGYRGTRVEDITRQAGIAQGTFYGFFSSKAEFVAEMVAENRRELLSRLGGMLGESGEAPGRDELGRWMREVWHSDRSIFRCIGMRDYRRIRELLPDDLVLGPELEGGALERIARSVRARGASSDPRLAAALQRVCAIMLLEREEIDPDVLERAVDALVEDTLDALYGPAGEKGGEAR